MDFSFLRIPEPFVVSVICPPNEARVWVSLWPQPWLREGFIFRYSYSCGWEQKRWLLSPQAKTGSPQQFCGGQGLYLWILYSSFQALRPKLPQIFVVCKVDPSRFSRGVLEKGKWGLEP